MQFKNLVSLLSGGGGVATLGRSLLSGGRYFSGFTSGHKKYNLKTWSRYFRGGGVATFGGSLRSGFTSGHKKLTLI